MPSVTSDLSLAYVRALAFQDGVWSFANVVRPAKFLDAIYWLYADGDKDLSLKDGWLRDSQDRILVKGNALQGNGYVGVFEIIEAQWAKVMGGSSTSTNPKGSVSYNAIRGDAGVYDWPTSSEVARNSFMGALRLMTGISTFDLPSEAEWEFAARASRTPGGFTTSTATFLSGAWT